MNFKNWIMKSDPRIKLLGYILFVIIPFLPIDNTGLIFYLIILLSTSFFLKVKARNIFFVLLNVIFIFLFIQFFNMLFIKEDPYNWGIAFNIGDLKIYWYSFYMSYLITLRLFLIILVGLIFSSIISLEELNFTIRKILKPFKKIGIPVNEISMILTIAIRTFPILKQEVEQIHYAQLSRGVNFKKNSFMFFKKLSYFKNSIRLLITKSLENSNTLILAMENRGYKPYSDRTYFEKYYWNNVSLLVLFGIIIIFSFFIFMSIEGGNIIPRIGDVFYWQQKLII